MSIIYNQISLMFVQHALTNSVFCLMINLTRDRRHTQHFYCCTIKVVLGFLVYRCKIALTADNCISINNARRKENTKRGKGRGCNCTGTSTMTHLNVLLRPEYCSAGENDLLPHPLHPRAYAHSVSNMQNQP